MRHSRGMTLLETVVWISIFTMTMLAVTSSLIYFYRTNRYLIEQASAVTSAQHGMDSMVKALREAAFSSNGAYPIVSIAPNEMVFFSDVDSDAFVERVHYIVQGNSVLSGVIDPSGDPPSYAGAEATTTLSEYVHNIDQGTDTFTYYDADGNVITDYSKVADVRFIRISLTVNVNPNTLPNQLVLQSSAALRNLIQ
jgi:type II secretory pathway pseudopilin PulG